MRVTVSMNNGDQFEILDLPDDDALALSDEWESVLRRADGSEVLQLNMDSDDGKVVVVKLNASLVSSIELVS